MFQNWIWAEFRQRQIVVSIHKIIICIVLKKINREHIFGVNSKNQMLRLTWMENEQRRVYKNVPLHDNNAVNMTFRPIGITTSFLRNIHHDMPHIQVLLRINYDKIMMICKTRVPRIVSGLRLCIKRIKKSHNTNINSPLFRYIINKYALCIICAILVQNHAPRSRIEVFWDRCNIGPSRKDVILVSSLRLVLFVSGSLK